jgi:NitT/TauT family transport system substrate-binding protein
MSDRRESWSRRAFLGGLTLAGTVGLLGVRPERLAAEPPPETTKITLVRIPSICLAPQYVAEELLRSEGFSEVHYVTKSGVVGGEEALASGEANLHGHFAAPICLRLEAGDPIVVLAGLHSGCFELFGNERVRSIRDLKGKTVAVPELGGSPHVFVASMATYVGLDPRKDIKWVFHPAAEGKRLFIEGKIDAFLGFPPDPAELRARKVGHVVVNSATDRPWSQYFCCMLEGNREFVRKYPVATKRALRAIIKANQLCALEPERTAQTLVERGFTARQDWARDTLASIPYGRWRDFNAEDTLRFYALRLHEAGLLKSSPQKIIAQSTDWRFVNELNKELKG